MTIDLRAVQPKKAELPKVLKLSGSIIDFNEEQSQKVLGPISDTFLGIVIV